jgi:hypothetical protein
MSIFGLACATGTAGGSTVILGPGTLMNVTVIFDNVEVHQAHLSLPKRIKQTLAISPNRI